MQPAQAECLSKLILFGERSLRLALREYVSHFHQERNHQGKGNLCCSPPASIPGTTAQFAVGRGSADCFVSIIGMPHEFFDPTGAGDPSSCRPLSVAAASNDQGAANSRHFFRRHRTHETNKLVLCDGENVAQIHARRFFQSLVNTDFNFCWCAAQRRRDRHHGNGV